MPGRCCWAAGEASVPCANAVGASPGCSANTRTPWSLTSASRCDAQFTCADGLEHGGCTAGDVDDAPASRRKHGGQNGIGGDEWCVEMHFLRGPPLVRVGRCHGPEGASGTGVVHQQRHLAEDANRSCHRRFHLGPRRYIGAQSQRAATTFANTRRHLFHFRATTRQQGHGSAGRRKRLGNGTAKPAPGPGDQRHLRVEQRFHWFPLRTNHRQGTLPDCRVTVSMAQHPVQSALEQVWE